MRHPWLFLLLIVFLACNLMILGHGSVTPAFGAPCGDGVGPCSCGDTVVTSSRLDGSDPVLKTPCPCDGLIVESGVTLVIGGTIRRGQSDACIGLFPSGIILAPNAKDVTITTGRIVGFDIGVRSDFDTGVVRGRFTRLQILDSRLFGIRLDGDILYTWANVVKNASLRAAIEIFGNGNEVSLNRAEDSAFGVVVNGINNVIARNLAVRNDFDGFTISGNNATVDRNRAQYNGGEGFFIEGVNHAVTLNIAEQNGTDGFTVFATESSFRRNRSDYDAIFGIFDFADGMTTNMYIDNRCTGSGFFPTNVPGAC
jgi:Right handed beta helix region